MRDCYKLQLAIYRLLLFREDQLFIFKGEKEMVCKERSEHECKSYPRCDGCGAHTKNLTFKHRFPHEIYKDGEWDTVADSTACCRVHDSGEKELYSMGPAINRLHEFEKLGYEPEDLKKIINRYDNLRRQYSMYRLMAHSTFGKLGTYQDTDSLSAKRNDGIDTLYYMCKLAGDVENAQCDDIHSMFPSMMFTKEGFREQYATNEQFKKMMDERIRDAILRPVTKQKIWVTTSSSIKDDEFVKKVKEAMNAMRGGFTYRAPNTFKIDELHTVPADDGWLETVIKPTLTWRHFIDREIGKVNKIEQDKEGTKVTITKNPDYMFKINRVLFNNPATIVFWADGDKTVVKCQNGEPYDPEKGLAMAVTKKALGGGNKWYDEVKKHLKAYEDVQKVCAKLQEEAFVVNNGKKHIKSEEECANCHWSTRNSGCKNNTCKGCDHYGDNICKCCSVNNGEECPHFKEEKK